MRIFMDTDRRPKRGDILQTNVGNFRERTCLILMVHTSSRTPRRYWLWAERWWQMEPDFRMRLYRSAERAGGQRTFWFVRYGRKQPKYDPFGARLAARKGQNALPRAGVFPA